MLKFKRKIQSLIWLDPGEDLVGTLSVDKLLGNNVVPDLSENQNLKKKFEKTIGEEKIWFLRVLQKFLSVVCAVVVALSWVTYIENGSDSKTQNECQHSHKNVALDVNFL